MIEGVIAVDVALCGRVTTELVGAGDLLQAWERDAEELLDREVSWQILTQARLAALDGAFIDSVSTWPQITRALLRRAAKRESNLNVQRAICAHPRLDVRVALLLWHLAARWGRVEPGGVRLTLPLTHRLIGRLVSAERPSVSHALARLCEAQLLTSAAGEWHLRGTPADHIACLLPGEREQPPLPPRSLGAIGEAATAHA